VEIQSKAIVEDSYELVVLIPCLNEERSLPLVIEEIRSVIPRAKIVVCDNGSTDDTFIIASQSSDLVLQEPKKGKSNAVKLMFETIDADIYALIDGDLTYDIANLKEHCELIIKSGYHMIVGKRVDQSVGSQEKETYRTGHRLGNKILSWIFNTLFKVSIQDTLSGYRVMTRPFVKTFVAESEGFELETDLNVHAWQLGGKVLNVPVMYRPRLEGSHSKLNTYGDGFRILKRALSLFAIARPHAIFFASSFLLSGSGLALISRAVVQYMEFGIVTYIPSLVFGIGEVLLAAVLFASGLNAKLTSRARIENIKLFFLGHKR